MKSSLTTTLTPPSFQTLRPFVALACALLCLGASSSVLGAPRTWNGGGTDNYWSTPANWGGIAPAVNGDNPIFTGATRQNNTNNYAAITNTSISFLSGGWTLNGNPVALGGQITNSTGTNVIKLNLILTGTRTIQVPAGQLVIEGNISGAGFGLVKSATVGTLELGGDNTYSGTTTITSGGGILRITHPRALGVGPVSIPKAGTASGHLQLNLSGVNTITNTFSGFASTTTSAVDDTTPTIENLSGTNTLTSNLRVTSAGGNGLSLKATGGLLVAAGIIDTSVDANRLVQFNGQGNGLVSGSVQNGTVASFALRKDGVGTWTLNGTNTYSGATTINKGTFVLGSTGSISNSARVDVAAGATFDVSAVPGGWPLPAGKFLRGEGVVLGDVVVDASATIQPGTLAAPTTTAGNLVFSNNLTLNGAGLGFNLSSDPSGLVRPSDRLTVAGNLTATGVNTFNLGSYVDGFIPNGTYSLIKFNGTLTGDASNFAVSGFTVGARGVQGGYIVANPGSIDLVVTGTPPATLTWVGDGGANAWDINTASNWNNGGNADVYFDFDSVTFDDTSANLSVTIPSPVVPGSVTVNASSNYEFTGGSASISGVGGLSKLGSGTLTIGNNNDYTGVTTLVGGSVSVATIGNGGVAGPLGLGSQNDLTRLVLNGGTLKYTGSGETPTRAWSVGSNGGTIEVVDPFAILTFTGSSSPHTTFGNTFTKTGPGTLAFNFQDNFTGTNNIFGGTLRIPTVGLFGNNLTTPVFIVDGTLNLNGQSLDTKPVVVRGFGDLTHLSFGTTNGAILNTGASQNNALRFVTLTGDTAFGGTGNWQIRGNPTASLSTGGNDYDLVKVGANQVSVVDAVVDAALGDIEVREGIFGYELGTTGLGNPARTLTVRSYASFLLWGSTVPLNKPVVLEDYATNTVPNGLNNTIARPVNLAGQMGWGPTFTVAGGAALAINGPVTGAGQLFKLGAGTLTLNGTNTYIGATTISAGKLVMSSVHAGGGDITVDDTTASPTFGVKVAGLSQIKPNNLTLGYGNGPVSLEFTALFSTTTAPVRATNFTVSSTVTVNINNGIFVSGQSYPLVTFDSLGGAGGFVLGTLPPLVVASLVTNGNTLALSVSSAVTVETWTGAVNGNWDIGTTTNWLLNGLPANYTDGVVAQFDDSGNNTGITVTTTVSPSGVIVNNSIKSYAFTGSSISGPGSLSKQGSADLTLASANNYSRGTTLSAGTLNVNHAGAIGSGPLTIGGGTLNNSGVGPVTLSANNAQNWNASFAFGGGQDLNLGTGAVTLGTNIAVNTADGTLTVGGALSDGGAGYNLTKNGTGTLALGSANNYGGNTTVNAGTLRATASGALPGTTGVGFTAAATATLDLQSSTQTVSNLVFGRAGPSTITITGTNGSALTVSPSALTFAPATTTNSLTVNMAALGAFNYTNGAGVLEVKNGNAAAGSSSGATTVTLAGSNRITAGTVNLGTLSPSSGVVNSALNLGQDNALHVNNLNLGNGRAGGTLRFAAGLTNPVLILAGVTGPGSKANVSFGNHDSFAAADSPVDLIDTTAGTLTAELGNVLVGRIAPPNNMTANRGVNVTASFRMGEGTLNASALTVGIINSATGNDGSFSYTLTNRAFLTLANGGTATITNLTLASSLYEGNLSAASVLAATLTLTNGATLRAANLQRGTIATPSAGTLNVTARVDWADGTLGNIAGGDLIISDVALVLGNAAGTHTVDITSGQNGTIASVISGGGALTKTGPGALTLSGANTYTGSTLINAGMLALTSPAALASTNLVVAGGATFDVTALGGPLTLAAGQSLGNSTSTGLLTGSMDATSGALALTFAAGTPSLSMANGTLTLNAATPVTVNNTGAALGNGSYKLIAAGVGGSVAGTAPTSVSVTGNGLGSGGGAALNLTGGELFLNVSGASGVNPNPTNLTAVVNGPNLDLSWPASHTGWTLQVQTNARSTGLATNWFDVPGSAATNAVSLPVDKLNPTVFFRMKYTNP